MFQTKVLEKIKTYFLCSIFFFEKRAVNEIMWKKGCRAGQAMDDNMAHTRCMLNTECYKYTLRLYNTYCFSTATVVEQSGLNVTQYIICLVYLVTTSEYITSNGTFIIQYRIGKDVEGSCRDTIWLPSRNWPGGSEELLHRKTTSKVTA